jgi:uncharacterized membrane protein
MPLFHVLLLLLAALLCSLVAGFLFAFAAVVMPGIKRLDDGAFIRAFQVIDGVIQKGQPLFQLVWIGSVLLLVAAAVIGIWTLSGLDRVIILAAAVGYVLAVQLPTITINIPLNNKLQALDSGTLSEATAKSARDQFEASWNRWNIFRTAFAIVASVLLLVLLHRL